MAAGLRLGIIRRWWWLIFVGGVLGLVAALIALRWVAPTYSATSTLFIIPPGEASLNQSFARTYAQMAVHPVVLEQTRELLALPSSVRLDGMVTARPVPDTQLVEVVAQQTDPSVARDVANAAVQVFTEQQAMLQPVGPAGPAVRIGQLALTPDQPTGPRPLPAVLLGVLIGVLVGLGVSVLLDMRRPLRTPAEAIPARQPEPEPEALAAAAVPVVSERPQTRDLVRGVVALAIAASVLFVSLAAVVMRGSADELVAPPAPQPVPAANVAPQSVLEIAAAAAALPVGAAPAAAAFPATAPSDPPQVAASSASSSTEPIPTTTDLPADTSLAFPSPQGVPPASAAEIAGATSAASIEPTSATGGPAPADGPPTAAAPSAAAAPGAPSPRTLFEDRFANGPQLWPSDPHGPARYEGSAYRLLAREPGQFVALAAPLGQPLRDAIVTASFTKVGGPAGGVYGLFLRDSGPAPRDGANQIGDFYVLGVDDRGQFGVWRREGGRWVDIVPLTPSDAVRPGSETNELTARALNDRLSLAVNGVEVATVLGTDPRPGTLGVYVAGDLNEVQLNRFEVQPATAV